MDTVIERFLFPVVIVIVVFLVSSMLTGCRSVNEEVVKGRTYRTTTYSVGSAPVWKTREAVPSPLEAMIPKGIWILITGVLAAAVGAGVGIYSQDPVIDRIAWAVSAIGASISAAGIVLVGVATYFWWILFAGVAAGIYYKHRGQKCK